MGRDGLCYNTDMHGFYSIVVLASLTALCGMVVGLFVMGVWRHLTRQLTRGGLAAFLVCAGIATVEAQKTRYVDAHAPRKGDGLSWETAARSFAELGDRFIEGATIYVKPGVYSPIKFIAGYYGFTDDCQAIPGEQISVIAVDPDPRKTIIDGGGTNSFCRTGYTDDEPLVLSLCWYCLHLEGLTITNLGSHVEEAELESCVLTGFNRQVIGYDTVLNNCLITGNRLARSAMPQYSIECLIDADKLVNCTIAGNDLSNNRMGYASFENCIIWGNVSENPITVGGRCNFMTDPQFVDAAHGDYHLQMGSPCINVGLNESVSSSGDLDGNPRIQRGAVDIGCYEYQPTNEHQTITAPVPVEFAWIDEKCPEVLAACGGDYDRAVLMKSANPVDISLPEPLRTYYGIWESYVADLDPTDSNQTFRATIEIVDGEPHVTGDPESPNRTYTVLGKEKLSDEKWQENLPGAKFFKVRVGLK